MYFNNPPKPANAPKRTSWKSAFAELLSNPALSDRDRGVVKSLQGHYERSRTLTAGRKSYFYIIKERTDAAAVAIAERAALGETTMCARLKALDSRIEDRSSWDAGFVESLIRQEAQRQLSARQVETLEKIEARHTDELLSERQAWLNGGYGATERVRMRLACEYYGRSGYYSTITSRFFADEDYMPTKEHYDKVVNNKYAQKVITAWEAPAKYPVGTLVTLRSNAPASVWRTMGPQAACVVISVNEPIVSSAKGCKRYKVLPVGSALVFLVEERYLKIRR